MSTTNTNQDILVTTIDGLGQVSVPNNLAHFNFLVKAKGETLEQAKTQLTEKTA